MRQALLERKKQEFEEEKKKAEADLRRKAGRKADSIRPMGRHVITRTPKAEAERLRRETEAKNQKNQRIQEMLEAMSGLRLIDLLEK